jgi:2,4-dienoyl-CoA reductase-like NADH-dependent reductase (Old Yellow Enzyme family)
MQCLVFLIKNSSRFTVQAPSAIPFSETYPKPKEMTAAKIDELKKAFADAVERCKKAGFDFIEIHGAHVRRLHLHRGTTLITSL